MQDCVQDAPEEEENAERWMVNKAMEMAMEAADFVNGSFIKPIKLEFEKVIRLLLNTQIAVLFDEWLFRQTH